MLFLIGILMEFCSAVSGAAAKQLLRYYGVRNTEPPAETSQTEAGAEDRRPFYDCQVSAPPIASVLLIRSALVLGAANK
eukprot:SAG31_NODE_2731_length_5175_cov_1.794129_6_plen_79_part_00